MECFQSQKKISGLNKYFCHYTEEIKIELEELQMNSRSSSALMTGRPSMAPVSYLKEQPTTKDEQNVTTKGDKLKNGPLMLQRSNSYFIWQVHLVPCH